MIKLGIILVVPLKIKILKNSWKLVEKYHIYEADAIQIASAKYVDSSQFLTGDKRLHEVAVEEGVSYPALKGWGLLPFCPPSRLVASCWS